MNKIAIPALLVATIMVAGAFAFLPVEQASTVHATVNEANNGFRIQENLDQSIVGDEWDGTITFNADAAVNSFSIDSLYLCDLGGIDDNANDEIAVTITILEGTLLIDAADGVVATFLIDTTASEDGCVDVLVELAADIGASVQLTGSGAENVVLTLNELDTDNDGAVDGDDAFLVANISGLSSAGQMTIATSWE